jgi:hypothetical protein
VAEAVIKAWAAAGIWVWAKLLPVDRRGGDIYVILSEVQYFECQNVEIQIVDIKNVESLINALAAWSSGKISACHRGDWIYGS